MTRRVVIIGIGADGMSGLAEAARTELVHAKVIYGSSRELALLDETVPGERREWGTPFIESLVWIRDDAAGDVHIVASGDPMMCGIGASSMRFFGRDRVTVLPHVSAVTLACARLAWHVQDTEVINMGLAGPRTAVRRGGQAIVLSRDGASPTALAQLLTETGRGDSEFSVLEQLGGAAERCRTTTARAWAADPADDVDDLNVVAVRYLPDDRQFFVLPDDDYDHDGHISSQSIRAITLSALAPRAGELLWDVGAGSGSIAVEWCRSAPRCQAIAFEKDEVRRQRIIDNALKHGVDIEVRGEVPRSFREAILSERGVDGVQRPMAIFLHSGAVEYVLLTRSYQNLQAGGRLVANTDNLAGEVALLSMHSRLGGRLRRFQHSEADGHGWRSDAPITQWVVRKP